MIRLSNKSRRPRSMILRNLALTFEDARRISDRKSVWMVEYLRARRAGERRKGFFRRQHLAISEAKRRG